MRNLILALTMIASCSAMAKNADCDFIAQQQYAAMMVGPSASYKAKLVEGFTKQCLSGAKDRLSGENPTGASAFIMGKLAQDSRYLTDQFYRDGATSAYISYLRGYSETN